MGRYSAIGKYVAGKAGNLSDKHDKTLLSEKRAHAATNSTEHSVEQVSASVAVMLDGDRAPNIHETSTRRRYVGEFGQK